MVKLSVYCFRQILMLCIWSIFCQSVLAEEDCQAESADCVAVGEWSFGLGLGLGVRTNPLIKNNDIPLIVLPSISYYGERFFIENLDVGYTLIDDTPWMFNLLVTPSYDRAFFSRWDITNIIDNEAIYANDQVFEPVLDPNKDYQGPSTTNNYPLKKRQFSLLGGMEISTDIYQGQLQMQLLNDLSDVHSGSEVRFAYLKSLGKQGWSATVGFSWKDKSMTNYYYGVDPDETSATLRVYNAKSSFNPFVRIGWREKSESSSAWRFGFEYQQLSEEISNSPLVNKDYVITAFIGKQLSF
ncbi:MipA/OmpV family protein [Aliikangiella sp. GXAS 311]|uniref:MipA/OmpV family protein n=1 Tax=Aliikangiella maris TaxID=3162458 RepID=A0ABV2BUX4_9GAMM